MLAADLTTERATCPTDVAARCTSRRIRTPANAELDTSG
jgi:hypothetical protein